MKIYETIMIDIKNIQGETILSVPITEESVHVEELMKSDYVELSWNSDKNEEIPVGAYIMLDGEKYSLLEPYNPEQKNEVEFQYKPQFHSEFISWGKVPFFMYSYDENNEITNREPDWSLTDNPANFMSVICKAIENETGDTWTYAVDSSLNASASLSFQSVDILSALNSIASAFETEWWIEKDSMIIHLSKSEHGAVVSLEVGENINTPSVTEGKDGYYTRFYAFGSTRNIVQEYKGANVNNLVNKRLTLDPKKYPNGYKDIRPNLQQGEIFSKILLFDDIYPSSELSISDVRFRLMWRIDSETNDKIQIGTDENGDPIYDQYAIWYFQIPEFNFDNSPYDEEKNPNGMRIPNKEPSVHFQSGALQGMEFELIYHDESKTITSDDGISFEVKKGDFEIKYKEEEGNYIIPAITGLIPSENDDIILFNIKMPEEYTDSAYIRLETAMNEEIERLSSDQNNYQFSSNPVVFDENNPDLSIGRKIEYINAGYSYVTRVISLTTKLDYPCEQTITIGNNLIKGNTQELKEEVASANKNIDLISAINDMTASLQQSYQRTVKQMQEGFARINDMWKFDTELENTIYSKFNVYSQGGISALGVWRGEGGGGGEGGLIKLVYGFDDLGGAFDNTTMTDTFNAYTINEIWKLANAGASTIGTGNVVTAVSKTALGIVVTKGITLYDWVRQPNKPTYSLSEINNVSGTYTGLTVGNANNADYATNAGYAVSSGNSANTNAFANKDIYHYQEAGWIILSSHKYIDSESRWYWNKIATVTDSHTNYSGVVIEIEAVEDYVTGGAVYGRLYLTCGEGAISLNLMTMQKCQSQRDLYIHACIDKSGNVWVKTNTQWHNQFRFRTVGKEYLYIDTYTSDIEITLDKPADTSEEIENRIVVLRDGNFTYFSNSRLDNVTCSQADKLASSRTIWGQSFDGTGDVSGNLTGVGSISMSGDINGVERIYCSGVVAETGSKRVTIYNGGILATNYLRSNGYITSNGNITAGGDISSQGNISAQGSVTALTTSDKRLKRDFDYTRSYTDRLLAMGRVCDFLYTEKARKRNKGGVDGEAHTGLLYQKVKEVLPSMAYETEDGYGALNYLSPDYINTIAGATQETARLVKALMEDIERLKKELSELKGKGGK